MADPAGMVLIQTARHIHDPAADLVALRLGTWQMASHHLRHRTENPADQPQDREEVPTGAAEDALLAGYDGVSRCRVVLCHG